jgi:hypothetical protein
MKYPEMVAILVLIIILPVCSILVIYYWSYFEVLSIFVRDPLWASVLVTVVLVGINAHYAWQTKNIIREMEKARKAEFIPDVRAELSWLGPIFLILRFTNFGRGPAINIKGEIIFLPSEEKRLWEQTIMAPNEFLHVLLPDGNTEKVCERSARIIVKGKYNDAFSQDFIINEDIDVKEFIEQAKQLGQLMERDITREVESIKNELGSIVTEVRSITTELERIGRSNKTETNG